MLRRYWLQSRERLNALQERTLVAINGLVEQFKPDHPISGVCHHFVRPDSLHGPLDPVCSAEERRGEACVCRRLGNLTIIQLWQLPRYQARWPSQQLRRTDRR
jgi:hypothetical protein